mgnify:FL=1
MIKLSEDEKVILRNIDKRYRWIARDDYGFLYIYVVKPLKSIRTWTVQRVDEWAYLSEFHHLFSFIKWEDEEPYLIEDLLKMEGEKKENSKNKIIIAKLLPNNTLTFNSDIEFDNLCFCDNEETNKNNNTTSMENKKNKVEELLEDIINRIDNLIDGLDDKCEELEDMKDIFKELKEELPENLEKLKED